MSELFRREAIEHRRQRLYGEVVLAVPLTHWAVTATIAAAFFLLVCFLVFGSFARKETVVGWVRPDRGVVRVQAQDDGVVESVHVVEGQDVDEGAPLIGLRLDADLARGESFSRRLAAELDGERRQLEDQLSAATAQVDARENRLRDDIESLDHQISQYRRQIAVNAERTALAQRQVDERAPYVQQGVVSRIDADKLEDNLLASRQTKEELAQEMLRKEHQARTLSREIATIPQARQTAIAGIRERIFALDQRITQAVRRAHVTLSAPVAGRVAGVHRVAGETARANSVLVDLLPRDGKLQVELFAPTRATGFVVPGSEVRLRYDAFPYQKFGVSHGRILRISEAAIDGRDILGSPAGDEQVYRIVVGIDNDYVLVDGRPHTLRSGMTLKADLIVERRSVGEYLFAPLLGAFRRG
jgi:membrane fusion protein